MPATDSPAILVARFLKANHYEETLDAFVKEAGLSPDAGTTGPGDWTLEKVLEEKKQYDVSLSFERIGSGGSQQWTLPAPSSPQEPEHLTDGSSNILFVSALPQSSYILVTGADKIFRVMSSTTPFTEVYHHTCLHDSPILSICQLPNGLLMSSAMSGRVILHDTRGVVYGARRDHSKYTVQVAVHSTESQFIIATAGWDQKVLLYTVAPNFQDYPDPDSGLELFGEPIHTINLPTNPESLIFATHPTTDNLYLILSRRDSTHLYYYSIAYPPGSSTPIVSEAGRQNLAPHSNAWVAFTPSCLSLCPSDPTLLAAATSHLPHMKLIVVRLLFPDASSLAAGAAPARTQAAMARSMLAMQNQEDTAIRLQVSTLAPQTPYSTPQVVWRPDGSGVWVNGDDGAIRGIEVQSGKVVAVLKGHELGTKVRTLWAGRVGGMSVGDDSGEVENGREVLISGGFDKKVLVWEVGSDDGV